MWLKKVKNQYFKKKSTFAEEPTFMVHQLCVDYSPKMVQDPEAGEDVLTVDGYRVADIKKQRGSRCTFCDYSKAIVICAYKKCKGESKTHSVKI